MGLFKKRCMSSPYAVDNSNPDPAKFTVLDERVIGRFLLMVVKYPNCTNFEGKKILVFENVADSNTIIAVNGGKLDPHFNKSVMFPVFARFPPTKKGWEAAEHMASSMSWVPSP